MPMLRTRGGFAFERQNVSPGHVSDVDVVASLLHVPLMIDRRRAARLLQKSEVGDAVGRDRVLGMSPGAGYSTCSP